MRHNWLHLDLKGAIPKVHRLIDMLGYCRNCGYNGIVLEYDDRIPWRSWPEVRNGGYSMAEQAELLAAARKLELEVVPLIQIHGHLEWLLKHPEYHDWRENGVGSEICPLHPEVPARLEKWIDEVVELHPQSRFIHLGADETLYLGTCPKCSRLDKMEIYLNHVSKMCRYALGKGLTPLIWADMFWSEKCPDLADSLPEGTILVDWRYEGVPPFESTTILRRGKHPVMGASGIMTGWWEHCYRVQADPQSRVENVSGWFRYADDNELGLIHTTWTRGASLWNIYGPWHGHLPAFIAGGNPARWERHPWCGFTRNLTGIIDRDIPDELEKTAAETLKLPAFDDAERECLRWWNLALRYQAIQKSVQIHRSTRNCLDRVAEFVGRDETMYRRNCITPFSGLQDKLEAWEQEARRFWTDNELSNENEFFATHSEIMKDEINLYRREP